MTRHEAHIAGIGTAVPYPVSTDQMLSHDRYMREKHGQKNSTIELFQKFVTGSGIHTRHYAHPHWLGEGATPDDYPDHKKLSLQQDIFTPHNYCPPYWERMNVFGDTAVKLAVNAAEKALENWGGNPKHITHIITTCTSGWSEPGIAVAAMTELGLPLDCQKAELNFNGCFCGATCLRLARDAIRAGDARNVLVIAVEVASTHYDINATDPSSLVAHALFADGAAAMVISREGDWRYTATGMNLIPESTHLLGLHPPLKAGHSAYRMTLHRNVGKQLGNYFQNGDGAALVDKLLTITNPYKRPALGIHPGGPNILDNVKTAFTEYGWPENAMDSSYKTLQSHGNLGAAAMLFVLAHSLSEIENDNLITMAFGPGVTVEWACLEKA